MRNLIKDERIEFRNKVEFTSSGNCVLYVMQRCQRPFDNPALNVAIKIADEFSLPVKVVVFVFKYPKANLRHYKFFLDGLIDVAKCLMSRGVSFHLKIAENFSVLPKEILSFSPKAVVMDENPLREMEKLRVNLSKELSVPFLTVDSDVIVPSKLVEKEVYNARSLKIRYKKILSQFLKKEEDKKPRIVETFNEPLIFTLDDVRSALKLDYSVKPTEKRGGYFEGLKVLKDFVEHRLAGYEKKRSDPNENGTSNISPFLHFGHISPLKTAFEVLSSQAPSQDIETFLDQLIIRRELAINFVKYNQNYDSIKGCEPWALKSLEKHLSDFRQIHSLEQMENCETRDPLWNAATKQMIQTGYMHNYLRMYWAKQILFWTSSPDEAFETAVYLNDKYLIDGRDPNGYAGIAWAIGAKHDRPFPPDKPVIGLIRPMTFNGAKRKFDVKEFCQKFK